MLSPRTAPAVDLAPAAEPVARPTVDLHTTDLAKMAQQLLAVLDRGEHADAASNPVYALFQVAVDFRCSAAGYRDLYLAAQAELRDLRAPSEAPATPHPSR